MMKLRERRPNRFICFIQETRMRAPRRNLIRIARATALAVALGAAAVTAMPAQAHGPYFSFDFGMGPGSYPHRDHFRPFFPGFYPGFVCYTDYQVRRAIAGAGYYNVYLNAPTGQYVQVRASRGRSTYLITFDRCRGYIVNVEHLRRY